MTSKIGVCEFSFPCLGPVAIELASRAGFDGIQLIDAYTLSRGAPLCNPCVRDAYLEAADRFHIAFQGLHLYALCHADILGSVMDTPDGEVIRANLRSAVEICKAMGIPVIMMNFNGHHLRHKPCREQWDNATEALKFGYDLCQDNGIQMTIESLHSPQQFFALREKVGEHLKLCFDTMIPTAHNTGVPAALIQGYGIDAIDHFHVHDCLPDARGYFAVHTLRPCLIGEGDSGFDDCVKVINDTGFHGWFISETVYSNPALYGAGEIQRDGYMDYVKIAAKDAARLRAAFVKQP